MPKTKEKGPATTQAPNTTNTDSEGKNSQKVSPNTKIKDLLVVKPANHWLKEASELPAEVNLYDHLWVQYSTVFLFGGPGSGKSILAVQIAAEIAKKVPVLYCDFELSTRQFHKRYRTPTGLYYRFPDLFYRAEFRKNTEFNPDSLINSIHLNAQEVGSSIIIIDNISWIIENSEKGDVAGIFMKKLSRMKQDNDYSILIVAHTPKRDTTQPINLSDMAGSMRLQNFIDSSFAVVQSAKMEGQRYIKQTKTRSEELFYGFDSVKVGIISQDEMGFTQFSWLDNTANEMDHLRRPNENERESIKEKAIELIRAKKPYREIQEITGLSLGAISKYKKQLDNENTLPF